MSFKLSQILVIVYLLLCQISTIEGKPLPSTDQRTENGTPSQIIDFMRRFGYLERQSTASESLFLESAVVDAIKNVQKFGALQQTGVLDNHTLNLFTSPRCGVEDIVPYAHRRRRFVVGAKQWQKRNISYYIANWSPKIGKENVAKFMKKAFGIWSNYSRLHFTEIGDPSADIIVGFGRSYHGDNYPFDGPGNILAHAYYPYEMSSFGGDIHFDEDENWLENATSLAEGVDFFTVALHELGHSLGLAHSPIYASVMFPYYKGPAGNSLDYDDVLALYKLYIESRLKEDETIIIPETTTQQFQIPSTTETPVTTTTTTTLSTSTITETSTTSTTFLGDYESVEDHKNRDNIIPTIPMDTNKTVQMPKGVPDICTGHFDTVAVLNQSLYMFKKGFVWKLSETYNLTRRAPFQVQDIFPFLPNHVVSIDAVYEREDKIVAVFSGKQYWIYDWKFVLDNGPQFLTTLGIPETIQKIDAAFRWSKNGNTYIFAGSKFWRYDNENVFPIYGYPKSIERWNGIPAGIDGAVNLPRGSTYFFKGNMFWLFNNQKVRTARGYPRRMSSNWLGCPLRQRTRLRNV